MNWTRFFTGLIVTLITFLFLFTGGFIFSLSVALIAILALWEFYKLIIFNPIKLDSVFLCILGVLYSGILILTTNIYGTTYIPLIISLNTLSVAVFTVFMFNKNHNIPVDAIKEIVGFIYISIPLSFLVIMRQSNDGLLWSLTTLCVIASVDIGAYYFGSFFGCKKLSPHISAKKTIEGLLGGLFSSILIISCFKFYFFAFIPFFYCILFACFVGIAGQVGDLFASEFKRMFGVKDYGKFLPGHGGFLDRIDSMLLALPVAYLFHSIYYT